MPIMTESSRAVGDVLHLPDAVARYPDAGVVVYSRVSSWGQAGPGKIRLEEKTDAILTAVCELAPGKLRRTVSAIEEGKLTYPRPMLCEAACYARHRGCMVVAGDLSRFVRAASYSRTKNRHAWPTQREFGRLHKLTLGVPLATAENPFLTEDERHSLATRRTGKAGRPRISDELAVRIFSETEFVLLGDSGRNRWSPPLRILGRAFGVGPATILRLLYRPSPFGPTWLDYFQFHPEGRVDCHKGIMLMPYQCLKAVSKGT